ncbi:MAG: NADH:ubiquinone reductase (Na(+)-transporting) subunit C [Myxococcota bacterium]
MRQGNAYIVGFAAVVCVVCSLLLSAVSGALSAKQEQNRVLDRQKNVLMAAGFESSKLAAMSADEVQRTYQSRIEELVIDRSGNRLDGITQAQLDSKEATLETPSDRLPLFAVKAEGTANEVMAYIYPVIGKGLWSTLYGYLAVKPTGNEIIGVAFYKHAETPGLGAEIEREWFTSNFKGKQLYASGKLVGVEVVKGKVADKTGIRAEHAVDGISGATLTGNGVTKLMKVVPAMYQPFFQRQGSRQASLVVPAAEALR